MEKPTSAAGYPRAQVALVRATALYVATKLGDLTEDIVIVGGLVPSLLVKQTAVAERHVGTLDLDLGMQVAILDEGRYEALTARLRGAGFSPDSGADGTTTRQRWKIDGPSKVTIDFLIPPSRKGDKGGKLRNIQRDFAAFIAPGLRLAFLDRVSVTLDGKTVRGERARRAVNVCGPGAFTVMKALALRGRGENKDAYDLVYLLRNYKRGVRDVLTQVKRLSAEPEAKEALGYLREDFEHIDSLGPIRAATFLHGVRHEEAEADAWGAVRDLLDGVPA